MADNTITIVGNVTRDPELKFLNSGQQALKMSVAVNRRWQNRQSGQMEEKTSYFEVVGYGQLAVNVAETVTKGMRVIVTGRLEQRSWETEQGDKRSIVEINADEIAPSLRWAKATVERNPRPEGGSSDRPAPRAAEPSYNNFDEEPF